MNTNHVVTGQGKALRYYVRTVVCPTCDAAPGHHCIRRDGAKRYASHSTRWGAWRERGGLAQHPTTPNDTQGPMENDHA